MHNINSQIETQYYRAHLLEDILESLKKKGINLNSLTRSNIKGVDEFHVRGAAVSKELTTDIDFNGRTVLDVGCGLGGPARMLADEFNCKVTGIDISADYIKTAIKLTSLIGLNENTTFLHGNALQLPFENETFDVVWTQHVQMNIEDKPKFYSEIFRVLKSGGSLVYFDVFKVDNEISFPVPWADNSSVSHLFSILDMNKILKDLGFLKDISKEQSLESIKFLENVILKYKLDGPPALGLNLLMGLNTYEKLNNLLKGIVNRNIELESGVYIKQNP